MTIRSEPLRAARQNDTTRVSRIPTETGVPDGGAAETRRLSGVAQAPPPPQRAWSFRRGRSLRGAGYGNAGPTGGNNRTCTVAVFRDGTAT